MAHFSKSHFSGSHFLPAHFGTGDGEEEEEVIGGGNSAAARHKMLARIRHQERRSIAVMASVTIGVMNEIIS